ncbi:MAG TPA: BON domain-containing protein [Aliidongia sp.]|nr:BON domain-containing protein [Aliidongia sp.]
MTSSRSVLARLALLSLCCTSLGGCVVAAVGAGAAGGGYALAQERGPGGTFSDTGIKSQLEADYVGTNSAIEKYVYINVFEGRVLLTGNVPDPALRDQAVAIAWKVNGVREVINEIKLSDASSFGANAKDNWIQTRLRTELTFDGGIKSLNYSIETVDGVVYIIGIARTQEELDLVLNHARNIPDVRRVVNYVRIRSGAGETQVPGQGNIPPAAPPPPPAPAPISTGGQGGYAPAPQYQQQPYQTPNPPPSGQFAPAPQSPPATSAPIQIEPLK